MPTPPQLNRRSNSEKVNLLLSFIFHGILVAVLVVLAAREGLLGHQLKKIAVEMVREKPPDKPKETPKPKEEPPKIEPPKMVTIPKPEPAPEAPHAPPPATVASAVAVAPPPADLPGFVFDGGKTVQSSSDPIELYRCYVESALRLKWNRPAGVDDGAFVAEIEITVDSEGKILDPVWKKHSGNSLWDDSVNRVLSTTGSMDRPPPATFPSRFLVRFDVQDSAEPLSP